MSPIKANLAIAITLVAALSASAITIDTVPVRNVGNANDPATGNLYGGVSYAYSIGKYEVTVGQYTAFLNAVAATDTFGLYDAQMQTDLNIAGIARSGSSGNFTYSVIGSANHPVTYVSWGDAARFANWLHNGQPIGAQNASTTEDGAYTLNGAVTNAALNAVPRNPDAKWFIPSENEWYKAAYYQPAQGGEASRYWTYPMRTNSEPFSDQPPGATPDNTRVGTFYNDDGLANGYNDGYAVTGSTSLSSTQNYLTDVGAYPTSPSFYGTFDQAGSVWEWNEALISGARGLRGGSWMTFTFVLAASNRNEFFPSLDGDDTGFRIATVAGPDNFGDYNHNATVDAADYVVWRKGLGTTFTQADYDVWRTHFGQTAGSGARASANAAVPEPATVALLILGMLAMSFPRSVIVS